MNELAQSIVVLDKSQQDVIATLSELELALVGGGVGDATFG